VRWLALLLTLVPGAAWAACGPLEKVAQYLVDIHGETPQVTFASEEVIYILYASRTAWTLVGVRGPIGCIVADGKAWKIHGAL